MFVMVLVSVCLEKMNKTVVSLTFCSYYTLKVAVAS